MSWFKKRGARRQEIRKNRPDSSARRFAELRASGTLISLWVAAIFCAGTMLIMMLREQVVPFRPGEYTATDITARVAFRFSDKDEFAKKQQIQREMEPRVYSLNGDVYKKLEDQLVNLPARVATLQANQLPAPLDKILDAGALTRLQEYATNPGNYTREVTAYIGEVRDLVDPVVLLDEQRRAEMEHPFRRINIPEKGPLRVDPDTYSNQHLDELDKKLKTHAENHFNATLAPKIVALTLAAFQDNPTHLLNVQATTLAQNQAEQRVTAADAEVPYNARDPIVPKGEVTVKGWQLLRAENEAYLRQDSGLWKTRTGTAASIIMMTIILSAYIVRFQPRIVRNYARGAAIAALMLSMLLAQIAGIGSSPTFVFGIAPTLVVAMILTIAYDQRFAIGLASMHAILVTMALNESLSFLLVVWVGVLTCCFLLDDIRTRSKLVEVGGLTAMALILAACASSLLRLYPPQFMFRNSLYAGAAGLGVGFVVLGILPFIEKAFRITTSMTLLELADASQPLLRRLALEAPGTYNHSLQVATLSEEAADAIGANSLLCRVGSYYHDIGKINKADYFIENQSDGGNRHINLSPSVSLLIIIGHVKDGLEMAREYNLPTSIFPFIQQHHGTTLVEFFYNRACDNCDPDQPGISEMQYRYPGPKPRIKEIAIVMLADAVESTARTMAEPTAGRIEAIVHELAMKRLLDGQFDECDLTMRDLERIEKSLVKTLLGIYHGRIAYPSTAAIANPSASLPTARTA